MNNNDLSYIELLRTEMELRNYSARTIHTYASLLISMQRSLGIPLDAIGIEGLKGYLHKRIIQQGVSVSSVNQSISAYKLLHEDILHRPWEAFRFKRPRRELKIPVVLSVQEVQRLVHATSNIKHRAILMLAYSAGLRKSEVMQIKPNAIDSERMQLRVVQGKGKKDRNSILSIKTLEILRLYYRLHRPQKYLFESQARQGRPLSARSLDHMIKASAAKAGIKKKVSFHTLRHCFATHLLEQGVNLRLIQSLLGHSSLKTTTIYLHVARINPAGIVSPLDSMNI
jgi:integrase/recombinase XerD